MSHELFFKLKGTIMNLGNKLTVFEITLCDFLKNARSFTLFFFFEFLDSAQNLAMSTLKE